MFRKRKKKVVTIFFKGSYTNFPEINKKSFLIYFLLFLNFIFDFFFFVIFIYFSQRFTKYKLKHEKKI